MNEAIQLGLDLYENKARAVVGEPLSISLERGRGRGEGGVSLVTVFPRFVRSSQEETRTSGRGGLLAYFTKCDPPKSVCTYSFSWLTYSRVTLTWGS